MLDSNLLNNNAALNFNFDWLSFLMKISGIYHNPEHVKWNALKILLNVILVLSMTTSYSYLRVLAYQRKDFSFNEMIVAIIGMICIQTVRLYSIYYIYILRKHINSKSSLTFSIQVMQISTRTINNSEQNNGNNINQYRGATEVMQEWKSKLTKRDKSIYHLNHSKYFKMISVCVILSHFIMVTCEGYYLKNISFVITSFMWGFINSIFYFIPYLTILIYISIKLIEIDYKLVELTKLFVSQCDEYKYQINTNNIVKISNLNMNPHDNHNYNMISINRNGNSTGMGMSKIVDLYNDLYYIWRDEWDEKCKTWQVITLLASILTISWIWIGASLRNANHNVNYYYFGAAILSSVPLIIVLNLSAQLNCTFSVFLRLVTESIINSNTDNSNNNNSNDKKWKDKMRLKLQMDIHPIKSHLFGYLITKRHVIGTLLAIFISKVVSMAVQYEFDKIDRQGSQ